jgi:hypothetical protein
MFHFFFSGLPHLEWGLGVENFMGVGVAPKDPKPIKRAP